MVIIFPLWGHDQIIGDYQILPPQHQTWNDALFGLAERIPNDNVRIYLALSIKHVAIVACHLRRWRIRESYEPAARENLLINTNDQN